MMCYKVLLAFVLMSIAAAENGQKLVCAQGDGSLDGPKGFCSLSDGNCSCSDDCEKDLSTKDCVCSRADLVYAQDEGLANCTVWTQDQWTSYVQASRQILGDNFRYVAPSNTPDGVGLQFSAGDNNLAWPVTSVHDMDSLLVHGSHCLNEIRMFNEEVINQSSLDNIIDRTHSEHCRRLARRVLAYYEDEEKDYQVKPSSLCDDIRSSYSNGGSQVSSNKIETITYTESYRPQSKSAHTQYTPRYVYNELYMQAQSTEGSQTPSQNTLFELISGHNLGDLLVKDWLQSTMTDAERAFIDEWESDYVVRIAALGIYCIDGNGTSAPISTIRNLLLMKQ